MPRVPYERRFLRDWIRGVAESPVARSRAVASPQTTYEETFRWHLGPGDRPNLFLFRHASALTSDEPQLLPFDAVLIDGHHGYEWVRHELAERGACVRPGGVILVHRARGGLSRALLALHAWAADGAVKLRWPRQSALDVAQVFEDLRTAARGGGDAPRRAIDAELRDLREDFEHEAASDDPRAAVQERAG
jgi:hypothetical protein